MKNPTIIYVHGKGGRPDEAEHYRDLFPQCVVEGLPYRSETPWDAAREFPALFDRLTAEADSVVLIANSIGAFFSMGSLSARPIERAFFISPIVDMERLIADMMHGAGVGEEELRAKGKIRTAFGETLSWEYLCYVREHPIEWRVPTEILCGERDALTPFEIVSDFAERHGAGLTVMPGGEHWFHTQEEMDFLDDWMRKFV